MNAQTNQVYDRSSRRMVDAPEATKDPEIFLDAANAQPVAVNAAIGDVAAALSRRLVDDSSAPSAPNLGERTMLVTLTICQWSARRLDRKVTNQAIAVAGAKSSAGRFNKNLVDPEHMKEINQVVGAARQEHADYTLPWRNDGTRILPADAFLIYSQKMQQHRERFEQEVRKFLEAYPRLVGDACRHLAEMFEESDYPTPSQVERRFSWAVDVMPMPDADDFRVRLGAADVAKIKGEIEEASKAALGVAMGDAWSRLHGVVDRMVDKLNGFQPGTKGQKATGIFRDTLVENVRDLVDVLPLLNIAGDARLAEMIERAREELCHYDAVDLRESDVARKDVAEAAKGIVDDMAAFMGEPAPKPARAETVEWV